ncbi:MAG: hypothetical protein ACT4QD_26040 [Acidobacteriota bacterium]
MSHWLLGLVLILLVGSCPVSAQQAPASTANATSDQPRSIWHVFGEAVVDAGHLPSKDTLIWLTLGGATAAAVHPLDDDVNLRLSGPELVDDLFDPGKIIGYAVVQSTAAVLTYAWGRTSKQPKVAHIGTDLLRAHLITQGMTYGLKYATRRMRPDQSSGYLACEPLDEQLRRPY